MDAPRSRTGEEEQRKDGGNGNEGVMLLGIDSALRRTYINQREGHAPVFSFAGIPCAPSTSSWPDVKNSSPSCSCVARGVPRGAASTEVTGSWRQRADSWSQLRPGCRLQEHDNLIKQDGTSGHLLSSMSSLPCPPPGISGQARRNSTADPEFPSSRESRWG